MSIGNAEAEGIARSFLTDYPGAYALAYYFRPTPADLYGDRSQLYPGNFKGGYLCAEIDFNGRKYRGRVDVPLNNNVDANDLVATLRHEVLGHYGINTLSPVHKRALLDALIAGQDEPSLKFVWAAVHRRYSESSIDAKAEEVFTLQCEGLTPAMSKDSAAIAAGAKAFNDVCLGRRQKMTASDLGSISAMVSSKLLNRNCPQLTFPGVNDLPRASNFAPTSATGTPSLRSVFSNPMAAIKRTESRPEFDQVSIKKLTQRAQP